MTISHNLIRNNQIGIWLTDTVAAAGLAANSYANVMTHVFISPVD